MVAGGKQTIRTNAVVSSRHSSHLVLQHALQAAQEHLPVICPPFLAALCNGGRLTYTRFTATAT